MTYTLQSIADKTIIDTSTVVYLGTYCCFWKTIKDREQYVTVSQNGKQVALHRLVYALEHGAIPNKGVIDHMCNHKGCCNPRHLELVTHSENIRRAFERKPRIKKEITKCQMTLTMEEEHQKYVQDLAKTQFEGNESMAIRKIIAEHSRKINFKSVES